VNSAKPLVSVIIPTHNRAALLPAAIQSVLAQSYENLELIVVDDASTDATPDVVRSITDPRLHYVRQPENRRAAAARNVGFAHARGSLIAYNDDDDLWLVQRLERQVPHLLEASAEIGLSLGGYIRHWPQGTADYVGGSRYVQPLDFRSGYVGGDYSLVATPGWLVRREQLERSGGFDERMRAWDDWELCCRLAKLGRLIHLDEPMFVQNRSRQHGGAQGMWDNPLNIANDYRIIIEKHAGEWNAQDRARHHYLLARFELISRPTPETRLWLKRAVAEDPLNLKAWGMLALTAAGVEVARRAVGGFGELKRALRFS
jgi:glycosyltransferase involved in cell wall biosynthesis